MFKTTVQRIGYMHKTAKILLGIGTFGMLASLLIIGSSANDLLGVDESDIDWGDWIVYQGGNGEIFLDEDTGYTVYVDKSNDCSVFVSAKFQGEEHYEAYCDSYYDFDNWMQLGDIYPSYSGYYEIEVEAEEFVLVDWTTPTWGSFESMESSFFGSIGCCLSLGILLIGIILAVVLRDESPALINQNQVIPSPIIIRGGNVIQSTPSENNDGRWWEEE